MYTTFLLFSLLFAVAYCADPLSPSTYSVIFTTDAPGTFTISIDRTLSPLGSDRFYALVADDFFVKGGGAAFFRVVDDFVVQFGISVSDGCIIRDGDNIFME